MFVRTLNNRILRVFVSVLLCFTLVFSYCVVSTQKACANPLVTIPYLPEVGITAGKAFAGLLAILGVKIAVDGIEDFGEVYLEEQSMSLCNEFLQFAQLKGAEAYADATKLVEQAQTGIIDIWNECKNGWALFTAFVSTLMGANDYFDSRINLMDTWKYNDDSSADINSTLLEYEENYWTNDTYKYYMSYDNLAIWEIADPDTYEGRLINRAKYKAYCSEFPFLLYLSGDDNDVTLWIKQGNDDYPLTGYRYSKSSNYLGGSIYHYDDANSDILAIHIPYTKDEIMAYGVDSNIPIFASQAEAEAWWDEKVRDGVYGGASAGAVGSIPGAVPQGVYDDTGTYEGVGVIGQGAYEEDGVINGGLVGVPGWTDVQGLTDGTKVWGDVVTDTIVLENAETGEIVDATTGETVTGLPDRTAAKPFLATLKNLFPFCIPFDLIDMLKVFSSAEAEAPYFSWDFKVQNFSGDGYLVDYTFELDLSEFDAVAKIFRTCILILFLVGLAGVTRNLIRG